MILQTIPNAIVPSLVLPVSLKRTREHPCSNHANQQLRKIKEHKVNYINITPLNRKHSNIQCNCHHCKQFDYANTTALSQLEQPSGLAVVELIRAIDSETWERHNHYMLSPRKPRPYNKYQR